MSSSLLVQTLTDEQLKRFASLIYQRTGIHISPKKKSLLSNRIRRRLKATGISCFDEYRHHLQSLPGDDPEWDAFLQEITTHETYLFRDQAQWDWFSRDYLPAIHQESTRGERTKSLRIWSAACSTGDEPYTIALCIAANLPRYEDWSIEILGTDIGVGALDAAEAAIFSKRAMQNVPDNLRRRFFSTVAGDQWEAKPSIKRWLRFRRHNLMEPLRVPAFDLIFVKNVLIYFDPQSKQKVFCHVDSLLRAGGLLVNGPAEGIADLVRDYERCKTWLHRKPSGRKQ